MWPLNTSTTPPWPGTTGNQSSHIIHSVVSMPLVYSEFFLLLNRFLLSMNFGCSLEWLLILTTRIVLYREGGGIIYFGTLYLSIHLLYVNRFVPVQTSGDFTHPLHFATLSKRSRDGKNNFNVYYFCN